MRDGVAQECLHFHVTRAPHRSCTDLVRAVTPSLRSAHSKRRPNITTAFVWQTQHECSNASSKRCSGREGSIWLSQRDHWRACHGEAQLWSCLQRCVVPWSNAPVQANVLRRRATICGWLHEHCVGANEGVRGWQAQAKLRRRLRQRKQRSANANAVPCFGLMLIYVYSSHVYFCRRVRDQGRPDTRLSMPQQHHIVLTPPHD